MIDKDRAAAILGREIHASVLLILTDVEGVYEDFDTPQQKLIRKLTAGQAEALLGSGFLGAGSMSPKVEAAIEFVRSGGDHATIARRQLRRHEPAADIVRYEHVSSATGHRTGIVKWGTHDDDVVADGNPTTKAVEGRPIERCELLRLRPGVSRLDPHIGGASVGPQLVVLLRSDDDRLATDGDTATEIVIYVPIAGQQLVLCVGRPHAAHHHHRC